MNQSVSRTGSVTKLAALLGLALTASGLPVACSGAVVGGECRFGYLECNGTCIDPNVDPDNCGQCGNVCSDHVCTNGACGVSASGGAGVGGNSGSGGAATGGASNGGAGGQSNGGFAGDASANGGSAGDASANGGAGGSAGDGGIASGGSSNGGAGGQSSGGFAGDASANGGSAGDASANGGAGGTAGDGGIAGAGGAGGVAGGGGTGGTCVGPFDTPMQCGNCFTRCTGATPLCEPGNDGYLCVPRCTAPLVDCGGQCVNTDNDENNCGRCGNVCASGICQGGQCVGATAGHIVVFCMDYQRAAPANSPSETLLGNAVFLGSRNPVRIYEYDEFTPAAVVTGVGQTLTSVAGARGRTYVTTPVSVGLDVPLNLNIFDYDVLLVLDQPNAPAGRLGNLGTTWADAVGSFVAAGGRVVVLAGDGGVAEMDDLITNANLLSASAQTSVTGNIIYNRAPADAVGVNVLTQFRSRRETCTFTTTAAPDASTIFVVTDSPSTSGTLGAPVVVHRVVAP